VTAHVRSIATLALLSVPCVALAQEVGLGWRWTETLAARMNPVGLAAEMEFSHRRRIYDASSPLFSSNHAQLGGSLQVTPASVAPALGLELQPLSVLTIRAAYSPIFFFGASGMARSYPSPRVRLGGGAFRPVADGTGGAYALTVHQLVLGSSVQARMNAVVMRLRVEAARVEADLHGDDRVFYDPGRDILVHRRGWVLQGDLDVLWIAHRRLLLGARDSVVTAWYPPDAFAAGDRGALRERATHRLGPVARYALFRSRGGTFDEGNVVVAAQWWLAHPDRAGRSSPAAVPLLQVALQVSGGP
jgi:hypothetical protein